MRARGQVFRKSVSGGSKSSREAVCVRTKRGDYILRRLGGHPFHDEELEALVGKEVSIEGKLHGKTLIASMYHIVGDGEAHDGS